MEQTTVVTNLRISNIEYFLDCYTVNHEGQKGAFEILSKLESKVTNQENPIEHISIEYRDWAFVMFRLKDIKTEGRETYVVYDFDGSAS